MKGNVDLQAQTYDELLFTDPHRNDPFHEYRRATLRELVKPLGGTKLLDVGCSDGSMTEQFGPRFTISGVDASEKSVQVARSKGIDAQICNVEEGLPYDAETFDIVIATEVLEHVLRTDFVLHEINRVLRPGGHLIVTTPNVNSITSLAMMILLDMPPFASARYRAPHVRDFTIRTLKMALGNHGFEVKKLFGGSIALPVLGNVLPTVGRFIPRLSSMLIALAQRKSPSIFDATTEIQFDLGVA